MEKLKKILASTKTTIILFIIILVLSLICKETVVYRFETLASYLLVQMQIIKENSYLLF